MTGFLILAFLILVAMVVSVPLATRFGLGSVLGYLLAGMAIAPLLAALNVDVVALQVFAEFGVVMMLFIIGLEMEPRRLWDMRGKLLGLGGGQVILTTAVITGIALLDARPWQTAVAIGMILALSSTAIIVQSLTEKKLMRTEGGEASFSVLLVQDVAVIPILALLPLLAMPDLYASSGGPVGAGAHHGIDLTASMPMWLAAIARIGAVAAVVVIGIYAIRPLFRFIAAARLRELFTGAALLVVIGIALLMSLVGLSPALGAFVAGVVLATSEYRHELESDIDPIKGLLLGLFFITVGAGIDFDAEQPGRVVAARELVGEARVGAAARGDFDPPDIGQRGGQPLAGEQRHAFGVHGKVLRARASRVGSGPAIKGNRIGLAISMTVIVLEREARVCTCALAGHDPCAAAVPGLFLSYRFAACGRFCTSYRFAA